MVMVKNFDKYTPSFQHLHFGYYLFIYLLIYLFIYLFIFFMIEDQAY